MVVTPRPYVSGVTRADVKQLKSTQLIVKMAMLPPDPEYTLRGCDGPITCLLFFDESAVSDPDSKNCKKSLICGTQPGSIYVWNLDTRRVQRRIESHKSAVLGLYDLSRSVDSVVECRVLSHGRDGVLYLWQILNSDWIIIGTFSCCSMNFCRAAVATVSSHFVVAVATEEQSGIRLIEIESGEARKTLTPREYNSMPGMCMALTFITKESGASLKLLAGYEDGRVALWDCHSATLLSSTVLHPEPVMCLDYSEQLNKGVSGSADDNIHVWTIDKNTEAICPVQRLQITNPGLNCVLFRDDYKFFISGGWDNKIRLFSTKNHKALAVLSYHRDSVQCVACASDLTLAAGSKDCIISLWNIYK